MEHLTFEKASQEITVLNALIRSGVIPNNITELLKASNDEAVHSGLVLLVLLG